MIQNDVIGDANLTQFTGFFERSQDYSYNEAKRQLRLALEELRSRNRLIDAKLINPTATGRGAITGKEATEVWDFLHLTKTPHDAAFTQYPHLTLGIGQERLEAMLTIPNSLNTTAKNRLKHLGEAGFEEVCGQVLDNFSSVFSIENEAAPFMRGIQRRYRSQRDTKPHIDALIEFDLRTITNGQGPKNQHQWLAALYDVFSNRNSNYQIQIGAVFRYDLCKTIGTADALILIEETWCACQPIIDIIFDE